MSGAIIFVCTNISLGLKLKYPKVNCKSYNEIYHIDTTVKPAILSPENHRKWETDAFKEYSVNNELELKKEKTHYGGRMQCFCGWEKANKVPKNKLYYEKAGIADESKGIPICQHFFKDKTNSLILGQSVAFIIIAVNLVLKTVTIKGIEWVGEDTNSEQLASITNGIFVAQFFNTGILILLVNGNMTEHGPRFITKFI